MDLNDREGLLKVVRNNQPLVSWELAMGYNKSLVEMVLMANFPVSGWIELDVSCDVLHWSVSAAECVVIEVFPLLKADLPVLQEGERSGAFRVRKMDLPVLQEGERSGTFQVRKMAQPGVQLEEYLETVEVFGNTLKMLMAK